MEALPKNPANFAALTPLTFLHRAATVYSTRTSIIYNHTHFTWQQTHTRCRRLAAALHSLLHISKNDVVSVLAPNIPAMYEMHFAVPMAGAILNTINTRLDAPNIALILHHSEAKLLFVDHQLVPLASNALRHLREEKEEPLPIMVVIEEPAGATTHKNAVGGLEYEELIAAGDPTAELPVITDEWDAISLNYTSGTTSAPKGVVYSHRGAYLSTLSLLLQWGMGTEPVYLWSLPMFHCNGWTFTWGIAARGGTNVCIRSTSAEVMYKAIADHGVTHMCCAPVVFNFLFDSREAEDHKKKTNFVVEVLTGGSPPPASLLEKVKKMGFHVTHAYGMTEATGAALVCEWQAEWNQLSAEQRTRLKARQGISVLSLTEVDVKETSGLTMESVPRDGKAVGEIVLRGSSVMKGYFKNEKATAEVFRDGWFLTGDVGVVHPDGYVEIKDRIKDIIISGGENICSVEVEKVLHSYYEVLEAAVVAMPHARWGETPCAFVAVKGEVATKLTEDEILAYCRSNMPRFMVPRKVVFLEELPKNSAGKIEKKTLREMAREFKAGMVKSERSSLQGAKMNKKEKTTMVHSEQFVEQVLG
ncbi:hypothetical protein KFK09_001312 [Dendrobium nobile]|uniref:4-coumarate--CoA ligase n=1 Tax=Dendrobium nobile TaxID=94219 RepID=A0A8T3C4L8_DENNO|nr:hypothetical protein KFK09_001312 [Dendrobium nobile]